jgi:hypothetical protein
VSVIMSVLIEGFHSNSVVFMYILVRGAQFGISTDGDGRWGEFSRHSIGHWLRPTSGDRKWAWSSHRGGQASPAPSEATDESRSD